MKVLIVEDERIAANKLERQLLQLDANISIENKIESVASTVKWLAENQVDLIFLDIHLSDGLSFGIFDDIEVKVPVIFTTAYDQYAIQAFKVNSVDYLLKPINKYDLERSLDKFKNYHANEPVVDYKEIMQAMKSDSLQYQKRFMVMVGERIMSICIDDVAYFFAEGKYVFIVDKQGERYLIDFTLDKLVEVLDPSVYFRVNRQIIIRIDAIKQMHSWFKRRVKIDLMPDFDKEVIVSNERVKDFKKWLNS
ncbi:LytR/AlgR family response regulator transcription factor [Carboxylicivirga sp. N1Y90]|uniref:LytR/AlgR family response regulator transcription factor n=1 Tax=Carboxylicivirga fragile TaxID=3417571 RepID=UPI003D3396D0|nr:response regulator transcription factor [Marinilabiliaceae bacterium N1Y90]